MVVGGTDVTANGGANCAAAAKYWIEKKPASDKPYNPPNNELSVIICSVTGSGGSDVSITFSFYVPEYDANKNSILNPLVGGCVDIPNDARITGGAWNPIDPRDPKEPVLSNTTPVDQKFEACALVIQKGVKVAVDNPPAGPSPTDTLEYSYAIQVSDYFILGGPGANGLPHVLPPAGSLVIDDVFSDGQLYDTTFPPTYEVAIATDRRGGLSHQALPTRSA